MGLPGLRESDLVRTRFENAATRLPAEMSGSSMRWNETIEAAAVPAATINARTTPLPIGSL